MPAARPLRITRFTVMATLQAARVRRLGFSEASAFSWGLNRAIFYAAAKRGFLGVTRAEPGARPGAGRGAEGLYSIGDDQAYRDLTARELLFTIGGETQTEESFRRQVAARFGSEGNFRTAWREAMATVERFDEPILRSGRRFYAEVYKPRRDALVAKWSQEFLGGTAAAGGSDPRPRVGRRRPPRRSGKA
jgi:hypothetical protein